jgi:hypothetical protein
VRVSLRSQAEVRRIGIIASAALLSQLWGCAPAPSQRDARTDAATTPARPTTSPPTVEVGDVVLRDLLAVEERARKLAAQLYVPDSSGLRNVVGGDRASQAAKAEETFKVVYEKELRRTAYQHGLSYEEALERVRAHKGRRDFPLP